MIQSALIDDTDYIRERVARREKLLTGMLDNIFRATRKSGLNPGELLKMKFAIWKDFKKVKAGDLFPIVSIIERMKKYNLNPGYLGVTWRELNAMKAKYREEKKKNKIFKGKTRRRGK